MTAIPANYSVSTVVVLSAGVNGAMDAWGDVMLGQWGKGRYDYKRDYAVQNLGYSTDNGCVYWCHDGCLCRCHGV